jgi:hypothetical protein
MLTEAQIQYITEVLGAPVEGYLRPAVHAANTDQNIDHPRPSVMVVTPHLNRAEQELLDRILASVNLKDVPRVEFEGQSSPPTAPANHTLLFSDVFPFGRHEHDNAVIWGLHSLRSMSGDGPQVAQAKKSVWALLQQFSRERSGE